MSVVIDNSVALAWTLRDEDSTTVDSILDSVTRRGGRVPSIFRAEFANGLTMVMRSGRIDKTSRSEALAFMETLQLQHDPSEQARIAAAIVLVDVHRLTVHDALYVELARREGLPLATLDKHMARAAREADVPLVVPRV